MGGTATVGRMQRNLSHPVLILAAGLSRRMGFPKVLLAQNGQPVLRKMVDELRQAGWGQVAVGISELDLSETIAASAPGVEIILNPEPERGMISTLRLGLDWAGEEAAGILAWPVDHPLVKRETLRRILQASSRGNVIIPVYDGRKGHPTWWGRCAWNALRSDLADGGARQILPSLKDQIIQMEVSDASVRINVNTPEEAGRHNLGRVSE